MAQKSILITGGTGSVGVAILNAIAETTKHNIIKDRQITVLSRGEHRQERLARIYPNVNFVIGDVRDESRVRQVMQGHKYVIHAAALKIAPMGETNPFEFIKTNTVGTDIVCRAALNLGVEKLITVSTDKAVEPVGAYGASKLAAESITLEYSKNSSSNYFSVIRLGNVLGSRGSVIPLFKKLASEDKPLPVTSRQMTRFFIKPEEAANLTLKYLINQKGGEIFIPYCCSVNIFNLAKCISDKIEIVGTRLGEKQHEVLLSKTECPEAFESDKEFIVDTGGFYSERTLIDYSYSSDYSEQLNDIEIKQLLSSV